MGIGPTGPRFSRIQANTQLAGFPSQATLTTALTGSNNDLKYTSVGRGVGQNAVTITYVDPPGNNAALGVSVTGNAITVNLATDGSSAITSTADDVAAAILASAPASALVSAEDAPGNDGTGVVTALAATPLAGGADYVIGASR